MFAISTSKQFKNIKKILILKKIIKVFTKTAFYNVKKKYINKVRITLAAKAER
jgi:hypothetical protein